MRSTRITAALMAAAFLTVGLAGCSTAGSSETPSSSESSAPATESTNKPAADGGSSSGGDYCAVAETTFAGYATATGDAASLEKLAVSFRDVSKAADDAAVAEAWGSFADYIELSGKAMSDPSQAAALAEQAEDVATWSTTISESLAACR